MKKLRSRWFSYSLRTLFCLLTIFGVWLGLQVKWLNDRQRARAWLERHASRDYSSNYERRNSAPWQLTIWGEVGEDDLIVDDRAIRAGDDWSVHQLRRLFPESKITPQVP